MACCLCKGNLEFYHYCDKIHPCKQYKHHQTL